MRHTKRKAFLILPLLVGIFLLFSLSGFSADQPDFPNIYIDEGCAGTHVGSQANPYDDLADINWTTGGDNSVFDAVAANEDVVIHLNKSDTWREQMTVGASGSAPHRIRIISYGSGANPIITAYDLITPGTSWSQDLITETFGENSGDDTNGVTEDNYVEENNPAVNYGGATTINFKTQGGFTRKGLIRFDLSSLNGKTATVISLTFTFSNTSDASTITLYENTRAWIEGTSCWDTYDGVNAWGANHDRGDTLDTYTHGGKNADDTFSFSSANFLTEVNNALGGGGNPGNILNLMLEGSTTNYQRVHSSEGADTKRPSLSVTYGSLTIWKATCVTEPHAVYFDGIRGTKEAAKANLNTAREWFWEANVLYVYSATDPDTAYTNPGIEPAARDCAILNTNRDYTIIDGLNLKGNNETASYASVLYIGTTADNNEVKNCTIENAGKDGSNGMLIEGGNNNTVHNCTIQNNPNDGIWNAYGADGTLIYSNTFSGNGYGSTGDRQVVGVWNSADVEIYQNTMTHTAVGDAVEASSDDDSTTGLKIYRNFIDNSGGSNRTVDLSRCRVDVYYNVLVNNSTDEGIFISDVNTRVNANIYNNVVYGANEGIQCYDEGTSHASTTVIIKNNIISNSNTSHTHIDSTVNARCTIDYNLYYDDTGTQFHWAGSNYNFADWKTNSSQDANSPIPADPLFVDLANDDFHLQPNSPCIDAGVDVGLTRDYDGVAVPQWGRVDIGAYEYTGGVLAIDTSGRIHFVKEGQILRIMGKMLFMKDGRVLIRIN